MREHLTLTLALNQLIESTLLSSTAQYLALTVARLDRTRIDLQQKAKKRPQSQKRSPTKEGTLTEQDIIDQVGQTYPHNTPPEHLVGGGEHILFKAPPEDPSQGCFQGSSLVGLLAALSHAALKMGHTKLPLSEEAFTAIFAPEALYAQQERSNLDRARERQFTHQATNNTNKVLAGFTIAKEQTHSKIAEEVMEVGVEKRPLHALEQSRLWLWEGISQAINSGELKGACGGLMYLFQDTPLPPFPPPHDQERHPLILSISSTGAPWVALDRAWVAEREVHFLMRQAHEDTSLHQPLFGLTDPCELKRTQDHLRQRLNPSDQTSYFYQADDYSRFAAFAALTHPISFIHGGPGTGKTTLAQRLLAILLEIQEQHQLPALRIAITAPTGKAAVRVREAIYQLDQGQLFYPLNENTKTRLKELKISGTTLHRLLKFHPDNPHRLTFSAERPLPYDVMIIDEASMLDLPLTRALLKGIPQNWGQSKERPIQRLIFLGDPDQLPPVGEGAVWRDVCRETSSGVAQPLKSGTQVTLNEADQSLFELICPETSLPCVSTNRLSASSAELIINHRLTSHGVRSNAEVLHQLFEYIKKGETSEALQLIKNESSANEKNNGPSAISWIKLNHFEDISHVHKTMKYNSNKNTSLFLSQEDVETFERWRKERRERNHNIRQVTGELHKAFQEQKTQVFKNEIFERLEDHFKKELILCAQYKGPLGVEDMNASFARYQHRNDLASIHPLLILKNHSKSNLYNGDIGFLYQTNDKKDNTKHAIVYFEDLHDEQASVRALPLSRIPAHDYVYAMSIHKSQGSEFKEVTVSLPPFPSPLLTRELFYTAVTRTKEHIRLIASEEALTYAIERLTQRFTLGG